MQQQPPAFLSGLYCQPTQNEWSGLQVPQPQRPYPSQFPPPGFGHPMASVVQQKEEEEEEYTPLTEACIIECCKICQDYAQRGDFASGAIVADNFLELYWDIKQAERKRREDFVATGDEKYPSISFGR